MFDLDFRVSVDSKENPSVFVIEGLGEIRIQKGMTRVNGVNPEQLKVMAKFLEPKKVKNEQKSDNGNAVKASTRKTRKTRRRGAAASKGHGPIA